MFITVNEDGTTRPLQLFLCDHNLVPINQESLHFNPMKEQNISVEERIENSKKYSITDIYTDCTGRLDRVRINDNTTIRIVQLFELLKFECAGYIGMDDNEIGACLVFNTDNSIKGIEINGDIPYLVNKGLMLEPHKELDKLTHLFESITISTDDAKDKAARIDDISEYIKNSIDSVTGKKLTREQIEYIAEVYSKVRSEGRIRYKPI